LNISQGSVATEFRCGGRFYFTVSRSLSTNPKVEELLKSVHICQSYSKNKWPSFFDSQCITNTGIKLTPRPIRTCLRVLSFQVSVYTL